MIAFRTGAPFPWQLSDKESACNSGDMGLIPGSERSPGEGNGNPLRPWNPRGAWRATDHGISKSLTGLNN